jgi:hypothetical protein
MHTSGVDPNQAEGCHAHSELKTWFHQWSGYRTQHGLRPVYKSKINKQCTATRTNQAQGKKRENRSSVNVKSGAGAIETAHGIASRGRFTTLIGRYICNLSEAYSDSHSELDDRNYWVTKSATTVTVSAIWEPRPSRASPKELCECTQVEQRWDMCNN